MENLLKIICMYIIKYIKQICCIIIYIKVKYNNIMLIYFECNGMKFYCVVIFYCFKCLLVVLDVRNKL